MFLKAIQSLEAEIEKLKPVAVSVMKNFTFLTALALLWSLHGLGQVSVLETCFTPTRPFSEYEAESKALEEMQNNANTQREIVQATLNVDGYWDGVLNEVYQDLIHTLECLAAENDEEWHEGPDGTNKYLKMIEVLRKGQRAWIQVRDSAADFGYLDAYPGSMANYRRPAIQLYKTKERTEELLQINNNLKAMYP